MWRQCALSKGRREQWDGLTVGEPRTSDRGQSYLVPKSGPEFGGDPTSNEHGGGVGA
jgi:hypothetical protein